MSYTAGFKLLVIETAEQSGNRSAGREHNVSEKLVRDWRKKKKRNSKRYREREDRSGLDLQNELAPRATHDDRTNVHPRVYAWQMGGRTLTRSIELARSKRFKRMRLIFQHFYFYFWCPCATYNPVRPIHRQIRYLHLASRQTV